MLTFEEQMKLQEMQNVFLLQVAIAILVVIISLATGCILLFSKKIDQAQVKLSDLYDNVEDKVVEMKEDMEKKITDAYGEMRTEAKNVKSELLIAKKTLDEEINKPISKRFKEIYHEMAETPEMVMLLIGVCALVVREFTQRRKKDDKEALAEFKASKLLAVIDGVIAFLIIPSMFKHGINAAVIAWKQAATFVNSLRVMVGGFNVIKSYFGTEVEMAVLPGDVVDDGAAAIQAVINRVDVGIKEAIRHHQYLKHDKTKDRFSNVHVCIATCEYKLYAHASTCHLSQMQIDDLDILYECPCQMGTSAHTVDTNFHKHNNSKPVIQIQNRTHYECRFAKRVVEEVEAEKQGVSTIMNVPTEWYTDYSCLCASDSHMKNRYKECVKVPANYSGTISPKLQQVLNHQNQTLEGTIQRINATKNEADGYDTDDEDYRIKEAKNLSWFSSIVKGDKKMERLLMFMKRNETYLVGGGIILLATLFLIMMYNEKPRVYKKKESEEVKITVSPETQVTLLGTESNSTYTPVKIVKTVTFEGKGADERRAARRAAKKVINHRAKPWWEYVAEREQDDSDYDVNWRDRDDDDDYEISAEEQRQIDAEDALLRDARMGYQHESEKTEPVPDFKKEALAEMKIRRACFKGSSCPFIKNKCKKNHTSKKTKFDCIFGDKCRFKDNVCSLDHTITEEKILTGLKAEHEKKMKLKTVKSHTKDMKKFTPTFYAAKYEAMKQSYIEKNKKEAMHNGNNLTVTFAMINAVGWCTTDDGQSHNATAQWSGFVISNHVFGTKGTTVCAEFHMGDKIEKGTWKREAGKVISEDTIYFEWYKCLDNETLRTRTGGGLKSSSPKIDDKLMQIVYKDHASFVKKEYIAEPCNVLNIDKLYNTAGMAYMRVTVKNSTNGGYCASPYINTSGHNTGWHNERGTGVNYYIGIDREVTVRATGSSLNL